MELLYVWVENYGNIRRQGFNFSPNYWFEVDEDYNIIDKTDEKKKKGELIEQPKGFFGDNISNITAIVGKNGSGKSNLLELILEVIHFLNTRNLIKGDINKAFKIKILDSDGNVQEFSNNYREERKKYERIYYSEALDRIVKNNYRNIHILYEINQEMELPYSVDRNESNNILSAVLVGNRIVHLEFLDFLKKERSKKENKIINIFSKFSEIELIFTNFPMNSAKEIIASKIFGNVQFNGNSLSEIGFLARLFFMIFEYKLNDYTLVEISNKLEKDNDVTQLIEYMEKRNEKLLYKLKELDELFLKSDVEQLKIEIKNLLINNEMSELIYFFDFYFGNEITLEGKNDFKFKLNNTEEDRKKLMSLSKYYKSLNISYGKNISKGEYDTLDIFSKLHKEIKNIERLNINKGNILILLDEPLNSFHPEWQREFIYDCIDFFKLYDNCKFQIILTSHSPFVASDLPRENVIMLDTDKDENCIVRNDKDIKTFGANIHTLLANSFFMESTLGEFAKQKITEVIKDLDLKIKDNKDIEENRNKEIKYIISLVGEPVIKAKLQEMYNRAFPKENDNLLKLISSLEDEIRQLNKDKENPKTGLDALRKLKIKIEEYEDLLKNVGDIDGKY